MAVKMLCLDNIEVEIDEESEIKIMSPPVTDSGARYTLRIRWNEQESLFEIIEKDVDIIIKE